MKKLLMLLSRVSDLLKDWLGDLLEIVDEKSVMAVQAIDKVKEFVEGNDEIIDWWFNKVGGSKGDKIYDVIKVHLPKVAVEIGKVEGFVDENTTPEQASVELLKRLREKKKEGRVKDWIFMGASLLVSIINKKLPIDLAVIATQSAFRRMFGKGI